MYHFTGCLYLPLVSLLCRGKIHHYLQVWFQLLTMWWTLESNYYIHSLILFGSSKPSRVNPVTQSMKSEQWQSKSSTWSGRESEHNRSVRIRVRHSPVFAQWALRDKTAPGGQAASGFGFRFKSGMQTQLQQGCKITWGKWYSTLNWTAPTRESRTWTRPSLLILFMIVLGSEEADLELSPQTP